MLKIPLEDFKNKIIYDEVSKAETNNLGEIPDLISFIKDKISIDNNYFMILYKVNEVLLEKYQSETIEQMKKNLEPKYLKEVRIFSNESELYIWRGSDGFSYRFRKDGEGDNVNIYIENHIIWGTDISEDNFLSEKFRGINIKLPFTIKISNNDLPLKYQVYNYFKKDKDLGLIKFYDSRLVKFVKNNGDEIIG